MSERQPETLTGLFAAVAEEGGDRPALSMVGHPGLSWAEYAAEVSRLGPGFVGIGVRPGDAVALLMGHRPEFHVVDTALLHARAVPFSLQETDTIAQLVRKLRTAKVSLLVVEERFRDLGRDIATAYGAELTLVAVDFSGDGFVSLDDVAAARPAGLDVHQLRAAVGPEDVATLIFTSGTTGEPKAVQLSHRAITSSVSGTDRLAPFRRPGHEGKVLSYLPLSHIAERFMSHYAQLVTGVHVHSVLDPATLHDAMTRERPSRFFGVPRVYEKLVDRARALVAADDALEQAVEASLVRVRAEQAGVAITEAQAAAADDAVARLRGVREALGLDDAEYVGVATAPSAYAMLELLMALGLPISDIWGMSEIIMCTLNPPDAIRLGTVGRFLDGVEGRIAEDGEILVRGSHAFSGYLGDPERTAEMWEDGWIRTGDVGSIEDGYLTIRGRKKELLVTATGKNIAPAVVEGALKSASPLIDCVVAIADRRRHVAALVTLDPEQLAAFTGRAGEPFAELAATAEVHDAIAKAVREANTSLSRPESIRAFHIVGEPWSPGGEELTPTAKLRRDVIAAKYADEIDSLYG